LNWRRIRNSGQIVVEGKTYDVSHLQDTRFQFTIAETSECPEIQASMLMQFGSHCVSLGPPMNKAFDFTRIGTDSKIIDGRGIERCFCPDRYNLSINLPDIIRSLPEGRRCYFTGQDNWLTMEVLGPDGVGQFYEVFFNVRRMSSNAVRIYVESAYVRTENRRGNQPSGFRKRDKIGSKNLLIKTLRREPIRRPKRI